MRRVMVTVEDQENGDVSVEVWVWNLHLDVSSPTERYRHTLAGRDPWGVRPVNELLMELATGITTLR